MVNGCVHKADGNFLKGFEVFNIGENLLIGSYPTLEKHIQYLKSEEVTLVLNLMTSQEISDLNFDYQTLRGVYRSLKIKVVELPLSDANQVAYQKQLFKACKVLHKVLEESGDCVFIHCASSLSRSPTLVVAYICLYIKHPEWQEPQKVVDFLRSKHPNCLPNLPLIESLVDTYSDFQQRQYLLLEHQLSQQRDQHSMEVSSNEQGLPEITVEVTVQQPVVELDFENRAVKGYFLRFAEDNREEEVASSEDEAISSENEDGGPKEENIEDQAEDDDGQDEQQITLEIQKHSSEEVEIPQELCEEEPFRQDKGNEEPVANESSQHGNSQYSDEFEQLHQRWSQLETLSLKYKEQLNIRFLDKKETLSKLNQVYQEMEECIQQMNRLKHQSESDQDQSDHSDKSDQDHQDQPDKSMSSHNEEVDQDNNSDSNHM